MLHWQLSGKHKFLTQLFCCAALGHLIGLILIFFIYRGDLYERHLSIIIPLDAHLVLLPFQKSLLGSGGRPLARNASTGSDADAEAELESGSDKEDTDGESANSKIEPSNALLGQKTMFDNGALERKRRAHDRELKRLKKLARERKERALKEKKRREEARKKAAEEKKKLAEEKKTAAEKKKADQKAKDELKKLAAQKKIEDQKKSADQLKKPQCPNEHPEYPAESKTKADVSKGDGVGQVIEGDVVGQGDQPFYIGQYDLETIQLAQQVAAEVAEVWRPPAGFKNRACTVRCILDWEGIITTLSFDQASGSPVFDVSVKQAMHKMKFPKELYGKEIILPFTA